MSQAKRWRHEPAIWLIAPLLIVVAVGFNLPLVFVFAQSLISESGLSLDNYTAIVGPTVYMKVLANTFRIALITAACCVLLGYPLAYWIRHLSPRWQMAALAAVVIPFWISILVRTYSWIVVLGNAGLVNRLFAWLGWTSSPVQFLYNELGVIIGTVNVLLPFLVLPLYAAMLKIDDQLIRAAHTLGASPWIAFRKVFFPLSAPALAAGAILVFILTMGFYITPAILGGGRVPMIANMLDLLVNQMPNWELAAAISVTLLLATLVLFVAYLKLTREETQ